MSTPLESLEVAADRRAKGWANLRPFKKGETANRAGVSGAELRARTEGRIAASRGSVTASSRLLAMGAEAEDAASKPGLPHARKLAYLEHARRCYEPFLSLGWLSAPKDGAEPGDLRIIVQKLEVAATPVPGVIASPIAEHVASNARPVQRPGGEVLDIDVREVSR